MSRERKWRTLQTRHGWEYIMDDAMTYLHHCKGGLPPEDRPTLVAEIHAPYVGTDTYPDGRPRIQTQEELAQAMEIQRENALLIEQAPKMLSVVTALASIDIDAAARAVFGDAFIALVAESREIIRKAEGK